MADLITTKNITKYFNKNSPGEVKALEDISVTICAGDVLVINGASGSGKTTLLGLLGCMARPTSGSIVVGGKEVSKLPERFLTETRRKTFGFIFQQFNLITNISTLENILLPLYPDNSTISEMKNRAAGVMERLAIQHKAESRVATLSGGEQQRVAIARALISDPQVIIADEPTAHLDTFLAGELLSIFSELHRDGKTIIIATHDSFVTDHSLISRVFSMRDGRIINKE